MTREQYQTVRRHFTRYVARYRDAAGALPAMQNLKWRHTACVVADAGRVMAAEGWDDAPRQVGRTAALLHDIGRFSQYDEFRTFQDSASVDHAARGCEVMEREGILAGVPGADARMILEAVRLHNAKTLPPATDLPTAALADLVRDADKLDIFRVMEQAIADGSLERNPEIAWGLQVKGAPSPDVVEAIRQGHSVSYAWIGTLADFILIQVGWLIGGLHYATACRLAAERKVLDFREAFLKTLSDDSGVAVCCQAARAYLAARK